MCGYVCFLQHMLKEERHITSTDSYEVWHKRAASLKECFLFNLRAVIIIQPGYSINILALRSDHVLQFVLYWLVALVLQNKTFVFLNQERGGLQLAVGSLRTKCSY